MTTPAEATMPTNVTGASADEAPPAGRWRALVLLAAAELLCMSLWFSASAVVPALQAEWKLGEAGCGVFTSSMKTGARLQ